MVLVQKWVKIWHFPISHCYQLQVDLRLPSCLSQIYPSFKFMVQDIIILQENSICTYKHFLFYRIIKIPTISTFWIPYKVTYFRSSFQLAHLSFQHMCQTPPYSEMCREGLHPVHISSGVLRTDLLGTRFSMYIVVSKA